MLMDGIDARATEADWAEAEVKTAPSTMVWIDRSLGIPQQSLGHSLLLLGLHDSRILIPRILIIRTFIREILGEDGTVEQGASVTVCLQHVIAVPSSPQEDSPDEEVPKQVKEL